ncbi:hypothetical protein ABZ297_25650 [Nonomuraea sp. NPDC005983]|uniref:hypothetical protein n=1 Tax=Nonomuraea sp. NPDC005983 TaxID=3155595 RepID=UPI0033B26B47
MATDNSTAARQPLTGDHLDRFLRALADTAEQALAAQADAAQNYRELAAAEQRNRATQGGTPEGLRLDPLASLTTQRVLLAERLVDQHETTARAFVAWWADVAVCAVEAVLTGTPLSRGRAAAADPSSCMEPDVLACLPPVPDHDRRLAELALRMEEDRMRQDGLPPTGAREHAADIGLTTRPAPGGGYALVEDGTPEARRRRLWGPMWREHSMPALPQTDDLLRALTAVGAPPSVVAAVREASEAVDTALAAKARAIMLNDQLEDEPPDDTVRYDDLIEALWKQADELPTLLTAYARVLTTHLHTLRPPR